MVVCEGLLYGNHEVDSRTRLRKKSVCGVTLRPSSLQRTSNVRLIPQDLRALHPELFSLPSILGLFTKPSILRKYES